jgi:hypothetical protein
VTDPVDIAREAVRLKRDVIDALAPHEAMSVLLNFILGAAHGSQTLAPGDIEYLVAVLLERPSPLPVREGGDWAADNARAAAALVELRNLQTRDYARRRAAGTEQAAIALLASDAELDDTFFRWPGELTQIRRLLSDLFPADDAVAALLSSEFGFDGQQAIALGNAAIDLFVSGANAYNHTLRKLASSDPRVRTARGAAARSQALGEVIWELMSERWDYREFTFRATDLAHATDVPVAAAHAFIERFSLGFGDLRGGRPLMTGRNLVRHRPLIHDGEGRALPTVYGNILWAIRPAFENTLRASPGVWAHYQRRRAGVLEDRAADLLERALGATAQRNVSFQLDAHKELWEADVLARVGDVCFVVEVKSGQLSADARRGNKGAAKRDLDGLLGKSVRQASRLASAILTSEAVTFLNRATGNPVTVDLDGVERVEPVVVTLEDLTLIGANTRTLRAAGLLPENTALPWLINVFDLEVLAATAEFAAQVTAFVAARRTLPERTLFNDEIDLWTAFVTGALHVEGDDPLIGGQRAVLAGRYDPSKPPPHEMRMTGSQRRKLRALNRDRPAGWLRDAEALIAAIQVGRNAISGTGPRPPRRAKDD